MVKNSISLVIVFLVFGAVQILAQKKTMSREVIVIEISVPNFAESDRRELLINRTSKTEYELIGGGGKGSASGGGVGCGGCSAEELKKLREDAVERQKLLEAERTKLFYDFAARAFRAGKNKSRIGFRISVSENCRTAKKFTVNRNEKTSLQLDCGVSLVAYYGFESEEGN